MCFLVASLLATPKARLDRKTTIVYHYNYDEISSSRR